jgi:hypothetical protein
MIRIVPRSEPRDFNAKVRVQGLSFLDVQGIVEGQIVPDDFPWKRLWVNALEDLYDDYGGICAYMGMHLELWQGGVTVDHFLCKQHHPRLAYEWSNFRLAATRFNSRKGTFNDVLDPFEIQNGWFEIVLATGKVRANPTLDRTIISRINTTIKRLGLNDYRWKKKRADWFQKAIETDSKKRAGMDVIKEFAPFVYFEMVRQGYLP